MAIDSCRHREEVSQGRYCLTVFEAVCQNPKGQGLDFRDGFLTGFPIAHDAGQFGHFGDPPAIFFAVYFDIQGHTSSEPIYPAFPVRASPSLRRYLISVSL